MRCYQVENAFGLENLHMVQKPETGPGPGEVRVRLKASSLNYRDILMIQGQYDPRVPLPLTPLSDGAGVIETVGPGSDVLSGGYVPQIGDNVILLPSLGWLSGPPDRNTPHRTLGGRTPGTLQEAINVPAHSVVRMPDHLSFEEGASLACAGLTAWSALVTYGPIKAGDTVLVQGTGGVSIFALQFARLHGARVIATTSDNAKADHLKALGAAHVINYKDTPDWDEAVRSATQNQGVDHVVEVGGAGTLEKSIKSVRPGGTISLIGVL
ncbi:MAG: NAD(P)-dependent alcohol dehydrogenase, partial [Spirochaetia bacterium]|nr:NAD(P)-dependent alcohol dehydrogenase [Spirochaetia bacterium]